uniref:Efflux transporter, RND family, MFP subunit n=1 Tax=Hydrogenovibrio crunogenus (strain DSM 25203 / XCL-2) TaxID=317025 RepID=Q31JM0_HYDCU
MKRLWVICLLSGLAILSGCQKAEPETEDIIRPVKYITVSEANNLAKREFPGILQAKDRVDLAFQVSGKLKKLPIKEGQKIEKGALIGQLDQRDYQAKYDSAVAEFKTASADFKRAKQLIKKEFISQSDFDKIRAKKDMADANVRLAKKALEDTLLKSPFTGTVAKQYVRNFTDIQAKEPIVSLQNNNALEIVVSIPEYLMIRNSNEQRQHLNLVATFSNIPNESFELKVNEFATEADATTRTYKVTLGILDKKGFSLYPGMTANVYVSGETLEFVNLIPVNAVFSDPKGSDKKLVWKIDSHNQVHQQVVEVGELKKDQIEIINGVEINDKIVTAGVHHLVENQQVKLSVSSQMP